MQDLSDFVFINMANITLMRCDSYLDFLNQGSRPTLHIASPFPDNAITKADEEFGHHGTTLVALIGSLADTILIIHQQRTHPTLVGDPVYQHRSNSVTGGRANKVESRPPTIHSNRPRATVLINDNYCVPQWGSVEMAETIKTFVDNCQTLKGNCVAVNHVPFVAGQPQVPDLSPIMVKQIKYVKDVSCLDP